MRNIKNFMQFSLNEAEDKLPEPTDKDKERLRKDYTVDGKYIFDEKLSDKERGDLLMKKLDQNIKKNGLSDDRADKLRAQFKKKVEQQDFKDFERDLTRNRMGVIKAKLGAAFREKYSGTPGGFDLMEIIDDLDDVLTGEITYSNSLFKGGGSFRATAAGSGKSTSKRVARTAKTTKIKKR